MTRFQRYCVPALFTVISLGKICRADIEFDVTLLREGKPIRNALVELTPNKGTDAALKWTGSDGRVQFYVKECDYVDIWADLPEAVDIQRMSGNFSQCTSVYLESTCETRELSRVEHIRKLFQILIGRYPNSKLPNDVCEKLERADFTPIVINATKPIHEDDQTAQKQKAELRDNILGLMKRLMTRDRN